MIIEIAQYTAQPGKADDLRRGFLAALPIIRGAEGCNSAHLLQCVEDPGHFVLQLQWETLEHHTVMFRGGPLFPQYRSHINGLFADPPFVRHYETVQG